MKRSFTFLPLIIFCSVLVSAKSYAQATQTPDTSKPITPVYNAGFDVIIKKNGDIIYGLVQEVGLELIKYQRTDIPNGPVYTIPRSEVHAISYRNQVKEFLDEDNGQPLQPGYEPYPYNYNQNRPPLFRNGSVRFGLGFIRGYTKVPNAGRYSTSATFPVVSFAYDAQYRSQMRVGLQVAFGSHKFSGNEYSDYDSTQTGINIKENTFAIDVYAKYQMLSSTSALQPYLLLGLGLNTSNIHNNYNINFVNNPDKVVQVTSGSRAVGLGVLARIGSEYYFNRQLAVFADVGFGPSVLNVGVTARID